MFERGKDVISVSTSWCTGEGVGEPLYWPDVTLIWSGSGGAGKNWFMLEHILKAGLTESADGVYSRVKEKNQG